jgi:hypothetical protein
MESLFVSTFMMMNAISFRISMPDIRDRRHPFQSRETAGKQGQA